MTVIRYSFFRSASENFGDAGSGRERRPGTVPEALVDWPRVVERYTCTVRGRSVKQLQPVKTFDALFAELSERAQTRPAGSGTVAALDAGVHHLGKKIIEEAGEVWIAAEYESDDELAGEISQLLYWTQVLMIKRGLTLDDVYGKL